MEFHLHNGLSPQKALEEILEQDETRFKHDYPHQSAQSLQWWDLRAMENRKPSNSEHVMNALRKRARQEIASGLDGLRAVETTHDTPYEQARYLAIVDELSEEWQPRNGIERTLIQQMAQSHFNYLMWQARLRGLIATERRHGPEHDWQPRISQSQAMEQAMNMADRFQRMFLRTQRALRDMRRYTINVEHVGQLNVADQQINVTNNEKET